MKTSTLIFITVSIIMGSCIEAPAISQYGKQVAINICKNQNGGSRCIQNAIQKLEAKCRENLKKISRASDKNIEALQDCPNYREVIKICVESPSGYYRADDLQDIANENSKYGDKGIVQALIGGANTGYNLVYGDTDDTDMRNARLGNGFLRKLFGLPPLTTEDIARDIGRKNDFDDWKNSLNEDWKHTLDSPKTTFHTAGKDGKASTTDVKATNNANPSTPSSHDITHQQGFSPQIIYHTQSK